MPDVESDVISFSENIFTKAEVVEDDNLVEMDLYAFYTADDEWEEATTLANHMYNQYVKRTITPNTDTDGNIESYTKSAWSYTPLKYWPNNDGDKLHFFAFSPYDAVQTTMDESSGRPVFSYSHTSLATESVDLLAAALTDQTKPTDGSVALDLEHVMTRLSLYGAIINRPTAEESLRGAGEVNVSYSINGITFYGIYGTMTGEVDDNGEIVWSVVDAENGGSTLDYTAAQGNVLLEYTDAASELNEVTEGATPSTSTYTAACAEGEAILVLPQSVEGATLNVRVRKSYDLVDILTTAPASGSYATIPTLDGEGDYGYVMLNSDNSYVIKEDGADQSIVYQSDKVSIPTPNQDLDEDGVQDGWVKGDWINMFFTFDATEEYDMPMTVVSEIHPWTEADIDVTINKNIYIYSGQQDLEVAVGDTYGEFMICTNYSYNLRVPHHRCELDGSITSSRGFLFYTDDFSTDGSDQCFVPTLLDAAGNELEYVTADSFGEDYEDKGYVKGTNGYLYAHDTDDDGEDTRYYNLLYYDAYGAIKEFDYLPSTTDTHEIDLSEFVRIDDDGKEWVHFNIIIGEIAGTEYTADNPYSFEFSVRRSTRNEEGLYVSTAIDGDNSYGVNKKGEDAVYFLRLHIDYEHLDAQPNNTFDDTIGVEMINNGGGLITQLFGVTLTATSES